MSKKTRKYEDRIINIQADNLTLLCALTGLFEQYLSEEQKLSLESVRRRADINKITAEDQEIAGVCAATVLTSLVEENPRLIAADN